MHQLILTVLTIALVASLTMASINYLPAWAPAAKDTHALVEQGAKTLERAFVLRAEANDGVAPGGADVDQLRTDGGLEPNFQDYYPFLPRAPGGYSWTYGYTMESQLIADGYAGNGAGGLYWFCLYPSSGSGATEGQYRGFKRAQQLFPVTQFYVNTAGAAACGRPINSLHPSSFPTPAVVTLFVRYVPGNP